MRVLVIQVDGWSHHVVLPFPLKFYDRRVVWDEIAKAIEARSAETERLGAKGESAGPQDIAQ